MAYLSEIVGREVVDNKSAFLGRLQDVLIVTSERETYPRVVALAVSNRDPEHPHLLPWGGTEDLAGARIKLQKPSPTAYGLTGNEIWLARDLLDKQVIDINDHRIVRVNDLELGKFGTNYCLINVDIGGRGLLRRLGWEDAADRVARALRRTLPAREIAWSEMSFLHGHTPPSSRLASRNAPSSRRERASLARRLAGTPPRSSTRRPRATRVTRRAQRGVSVSPGAQRTRTGRGKPTSQIHSSPPSVTSSAA